MESEQPAAAESALERWPARKRIALRVGIACSVPLLLLVLYNVLIRGPGEWDILFYPLMIIVVVLSVAVGLVGGSAVLVGFWLYDKAKACRF